MNISKISIDDFAHCRLPVSRWLAVYYATLDDKEVQRGVAQVIEQIHDETEKFHTREVYEILCEHAEWLRKLFQTPSGTVNDVGENGARG